MGLHADKARGSGPRPRSRRPATMFAIIALPALSVLLSSTILHLGTVDRRAPAGNRSNRRMMLRIDVVEDVRVVPTISEDRENVHTQTVQHASSSSLPSLGNPPARPSEQLHEAKGEEERHWLYTVVDANHEGAAVLLTHWLDHYLGTLEFDSRHLIMVVHKNSTCPVAAAEFEAVMQVLHGWQIQYFLWTEQYSTDAQLAVRLTLLQQLVRNPSDWVTIADSDEFHAYDTAGGTAVGLTTRASAAGANFVMGELVDRVSLTGELQVVQLGPGPVQDQFPLRCSVVRRVAGGSAAKVVAARAYWRTDARNNGVVTADRAAEYFGPALPGIHNERDGWLGADDLWALTPYAADAQRYWQPEEPDSQGQYRPVQYQATLPVHHLKWHSGVARSTADRLEHERGNVTGAVDAAGFLSISTAMRRHEVPRYGSYRESARILSAVRAGRLDLEAAACKKPDGSVAANPPPFRKMKLLEWEQGSRDTA